MRRGVVDRAELVDDAVGVDAACASGVSGSSSAVRPAREASGPRSGRRSTRVARSSASRSDFAFGSVRSWGSTSSSPGFGQRERADHAAGVAAVAVRVA